MTDVALVAGATGVSGRSLINQFIKSGHWKGIYSGSRRPLEFGNQVKHVPLDMSTDTSVKSAVAKVSDTTHIFFCAFSATGDLVKDVDVNYGMFKRLVEASEAAGLRLKHVHFLSGTKWYGLHLGCIGKTPSKEDDPRAMPPNFYYNMEDYCMKRVSQGASWTWSSVRPNPICGFSTGSAMNLTVTIAVYASICKALDLPLRFPGTPEAYNALLEVVDVEVMGEAIEWMAVHPEAGNNAYNISNGDVFRWSEIWPKIATHFMLPTAAPQKFDLVTTVGSQEETWNSIVKENQLVPHSYKDIATWEFGNFIFAQEKDWFSNVNKLRQAGYAGMIIDSDEMFIRQFEQLRKDKIIP